jgi:glutaredoxin
MPLKYKTHIRVKKHAALLLILLLVLCATPVQAQAPQPIVHAVMFWMRGCPHCEDVIANVLPPLREKYGAQFDLFMIEVEGAQDVDNLYRVAVSYKFTKEQTGVPFLIIGDQVLIGSDQVREQLSALIDDHLTRGGLDWPANPFQP